MRLRAAIDNIALTFVVLALALAAGCASTVTGGTSRSVDDRTTVTTGATALDTRTTSLTVTPDGDFAVTTVTATATTRPTRTEHVRTERAATQPSASSTRGTPNVRIDAGGTVRGLSFDLDKLAAQAWARATITVPLTVGALAFLLLRKWVPAGLCFGAALAAALVPAWLVAAVAITAVAGTIAWQLWGERAKDKNITQLVAGAENLLGTFDASGRDFAKGLMAQAHDESTKAVVRDALGKK